MTRLLAVFVACLLMGSGAITLSGCHVITDWPVRRQAEDQEDTKTKSPRTPEKTERPRRRPAQKKTPCGFGEASEAIDRLTANEIFSGFALPIDTILCVGLTVEAWVEFKSSDRHYIEQVFPRDPTDGTWYVWLKKFFDVGEKTLRIFEAAKKHRTVVFVFDVKRDQYGNIISRRRVPVARFEFSRQTHEKVNWNYVDKLFYGMIVDASRYGIVRDIHREKLVAMIDSYWVDRSYLR